MSVLQWYENCPSSNKNTLRDGRRIYSIELIDIKKPEGILPSAVNKRLSASSGFDTLNISKISEIVNNTSKVVDENGEPLVVWHGTSENFNEFDRTKTRANMDIQGNFFSPWEIDAGGYGENLRKFFINLKNPANFATGFKALKLFQGLNKAGEKAANYLIKKGYDGVNNDDEEYIVFDAENIKSADPVTRDDDGEIIPLSERFNPTKKDIRYSLKTLDAEYMKAVKANDMGTAQKLVDEAYKKAFPNSVMTDTSDNPIAMYHGSDGDFNEYQFGRKTKRYYLMSDVDVESQAAFFAPTEEEAKEYGSNVKKVYLNITKLLSEKDADIALKPAIYILKMDTITLI